MCGIAGIINFKNPEEKIPLLKKMVGYIRHRGPDASGVFAEGPAGLGHARLSIIDLSTAGDQPIHNEDKTVWIVFNGEIFNYPELREDLKRKGHTFYTKTDTEVIVHLYEEHGTELFQYLNGQFAFAIWDKNKNKVLLGRDRVGIRPLFYFYENGRLVFGSEIKAIFADLQIPREMNPRNISDIFTCWSSMDASTPFKGIYQLPPGNYLEFSTQGMNIAAYWELDFSNQHKDEYSLSEWVEQLSALILDASRIRLRADVPVGAYLSGGIDSTYISSLVKQNFNNKLCTFSVGFEDKKFDESDYQKTAVASIGTDHKTIHCAYKDIGENFPKVVWHTETPIIRTAPAPLMLLSGLVRQSDFKVVLTGEGADEIFAGYNIFREDKVRRFWARHPDSSLRPRLLEKLYPYIFTSENKRSIKMLMQFFKKDFEKLDLPTYSHMLRWQNTSQLKHFFSQEFLKNTGDLNSFVERYTQTLPKDFMTWKPLSRAQYIENRIFLSNYLLSSQGDRMAMANSVEGRYPFLDHRVIEFATKIPERFRMNGINEKYILKKAARGKIPDGLIDRSKQPYRAPISQAFLGKFQPDYVDDLLSEQAILQAGFFDSKKVKILLAKCRKQEGYLLSERENMAIVGILSTQLLNRHFITDFPQEPERQIDDTKVFL